MSLKSYLNDLVNKNHRAFQQHTNLRWMNPYQAMELENQRDSILQSLNDQLT